MLIGYKLGQGSIVLRVKIRNSSVSTGAGLTGLTSASAGLIISTIADNESAATAYTVAGSTIETITTLGTYAAPTATKCRFKEVDSTNHKGIYEIQIADARFAVASAKSVLVSISGATNAAECDVLIPLTSMDPYDTVRLGLTALPNIASGNAGAIITSGTGTAQLTTSSGAVTVGTNNDKTGYSLTQSFPTNFASLAITAAGGVTLADGVTHGGTSTIITFERMIGVSTTLNQPCVSLTGKGTGAGFFASGASGSSGAGMELQGGDSGPTGGAGLVAIGGNGSGTGGIGIHVLSGTPSGSALVLVGTGSGDGISSTAGSTGHSMHIIGGATSGAAIKLETLTDPGIDENGTDYKAAIWAATTRTLTSAANITSTGGTTVPQTGDSFARIGAAGAGLTAITGATLSSAYDFAKGTVAVTESYNADGSAPTPVQALMLILQMLTEKAISSTTLTVKKLDGTTTAATFTLDSATTPTSITRAT